MIRLTAAGYLLFFVPDLVLAATHHIGGLPPLLARLFDWGQGGTDAVPCSSWPSPCGTSTSTLREYSRSH